MARLVPMSWQEFVRRLRELGFDGPYAGGRHPQMRRRDITVIIPNLHIDIQKSFVPPPLLVVWYETFLGNYRGDIGVDLLRRILRQAAISREEWLDEE